MPKNIAKYLANYAEPETLLLDSFPADSCFHHGVVIPAYKEKSTFVKRFIASPLAQQQALMVIVINQPDCDNNLLLQQQLFQDCCALGKLVWQNNSLTLVSLTNPDTNVNSALLLVDRFSTAIPEKMGVGLARKIGTDLLVALIAKKFINSTWLYSSDADTSLPDNYFTTLAAIPKNTVAACFNFYHHSDNNDIHQANHLYEQALRYYVAGLSYANSPYNFFTIGSILAFSANAYACARGFPKRSAGEDFYLLNKLAKLGKVSFADKCVLKIEARTSDRVPFGTGPAVKEILSLQQAKQDYCYYHPQVFDHLKQLLSNFSQLWEYRHNLVEWYSHQTEITALSLQSIGFDQFVQKQQNSSSTQFNKQLQVWFDAFKTLKYIHALRANGLADIALKDAIALANFTLPDSQ